MTFISVLLKSLGMSFLICAIVVVIALVISVIWVRTTTKGKIYCFFLATNKQLSAKLLKPHSSTVTVGTGEDAPKFLIHPSKQFLSYWPPGFPKFIQEPVPTLLYAEGNVEPLDPWDRKALISPEVLRKISDESMLKQLWKDVRESVGLKAGLAGNKLLLILVLAAIVAGVIAAYLSFTNVSQVGKILKILGG